MIRDSEETQAETPCEWILREACGESRPAYGVDDPMSRKLFIFENGRRYERMLIEEAQRSVPPIELPDMRREGNDERAERAMLAMLQRKYGSPK